jgi:hypothetical protein
MCESVRRYGISVVNEVSKKGSRTSYITLFMSVLVISGGWYGSIRLGTVQEVELK